jgi:hypothetical protein
VSADELDTRTSEESESLVRRTVQSIAPQDMIWKLYSIAAIVQHAPQGLMSM